jgi:osmotically inducible protein OsmC
MAAIRRAEVTWEGDLASGGGKASASTSHAFNQLAVSWPARTEQPDGKTSPEELLAAAHASCFAMALSAGLGRAGTPPQKLDVNASVTFDKVGDAYRVVSSVLEVRGRVRGLDSQGFQRAAEAAKDGCPISQALKGNVDMSVRATLEG